MNSEQFTPYLVLAISYFFVGFMLIFFSIIKKIDILEPIVLVTLLYMAIFTITPLNDVLRGDTRIYGVEMFDSCVRATMIYMFSMLAFYFGYFIRRGNNKIIIKPVLEDSNDNKHSIIRMSFVIWSISYMLTLFFLIAKGRSFLYILTIGGVGGLSYTSISGAQIGFISICSYAMVPAWMYIYVYTNNKILKFIIWFLTITSFLIRGFRFILIIMLAAPVVFYYIKKNIRPKIINIALFMALFIFMIGTVGFMRNSVRHGTVVDWENLDVGYMLNATIESFEIYKPFYGLVNAVPKVHGYTLGKQLFYTVVITVPRLIWPEKPLPVMKELMSVSVNSYAVRAGAAWPNIGEYYSEFGVAGCVVLMFLFGLVCSWCKKLYQSDTRTTHSLIAYSIILPSLLQLIIRGYTPTNFYLMLLLLLPIWFIKKFHKLL
jgi:oligosaccharide repeat unit polymerase